MKHTPLVSVIMPAYNSALFIKEAITSVLNQTYTHWELFVIDDASVDDTIAITTRLMEQDSRIQVLKTANNQGSGAARNMGIAAAKGDFIAFLDSDDLWLTQKLEVQVKFMEDLNLAMSFSSYGLISESGKVSNKYVEALPLLTYEKLLKSNYVGNLTGMYSVTKLGKVYSPLLRKRQDWALWLSILKREGHANGILQPLALYRSRKDSISNHKTALVKYNFRIYHQFLNFGYLKSCRYMTRFLWEHFRVKNKQKKLLNKGSKLL